MSVLKRLQSLKLEKDSMITLTLKEGADVFHYNETEIEDAMNETTVVSEFAALIANTKLDARNRWNGNVIEHLRAHEYLDDYERGSYTFEEYLTETLSENFYDHELIEYSTEKYDHKRGFTTLSAQVDIPVSNFIEEDPSVSGWEVSVQTDNGVLTFKL
jgi:hypothetical protein